MDKINIGDYVTGKEYRLDESAKVIGIFGVDAIVVRDGEGSSKVNKESIAIWGKLSGPVKLIDNVERFIGQIWNYYPINGLVKREVKAQESKHPYVRICAKCGQFDEYAAPSDKHNGEVRCYKHC